MKELIFKLLLWEGVVVLKKLTFNSSMLGRYGGPQRTDF